MSRSLLYVSQRSGISKSEGDDTLLGCWEKLPKKGGFGKWTPKCHPLKSVII